jgi:RNA polymerase sigma-70 factor (ECF subfamily)
MGDIDVESVIDLNEAAVRDRTKEAFQELVLPELPALYSLARRLVRDGAEDLVQEALLQAFRAFASLRDDEAVRRWLKTIVVNVFRDQLRKRSRTVDERPMGDLSDFSLYRTLADEDPFPYSDTLHADFLQVFDSEDLREVLIRLPDIYRIPLVLRYVDGFATKEIARLMEAPLGTILARLHRGRQLFEREMWAYAQEAGLLTEER